MVTRSPLATSSLPSDEQIIPFPRDDVTPPVTKIYFVDMNERKLFKEIRK